MKTTIFDEKLHTSQSIHVQQVLEPWEFLGFETRNKYRILDESNSPIGFAAETSKGFLATLTRLFLKHWRSFEIHIFSQDRQLLYRAKFPFRWFLKTLYLETADGEQLGHLQERWAFFRKKFDLHDSNGKVIARINSPFFKMWTFEFHFASKKLGTIQKKWSGALTEIFTDKDNFVVSFASQDLDIKTKALMMATCLMVDIVYFENNKGSAAVNLME